MGFSASATSEMAGPFPGPEADRSSLLFGDTMVPNLEEDSIVLLGYSILYKEYDRTRFNHQKARLTCMSTGLLLRNLD